MQSAVAAARARGSKISDHQISVVAACVVAWHAANDLVAESQIQFLSNLVCRPDLEPHAFYGAAQKTLFDLVHKGAAETTAPVGR